MSARYLLRFDDICPTMNWETWSAIEDILIAAGVKPILAVVPDNRDKKLQVASALPYFWDCVRGWQQMGWAIGIHGYNHSYVTNDAGMIGLNQQSEFAGLPAEDQEFKLRSSLEIFRREKVNPDLWIAPGHSFDATTLAVLRHSGIRFISDGLFFFPHTDADGIMWIPQQLWRFRPMPWGVWTICFHHNKWKPDTVDKFRKDIQAYRKRIISFHKAVDKYKDRQRGWMDAVVARSILASILLTRHLHRWLLG